MPREFKLVLADLIVTGVPTTVVLPDNCPRCDAPLFDRDGYGIVETSWQRHFQRQQVQATALQAHGPELPDDVPQRLVTGLACGTCRKPLVESRCNFTKPGDPLNEEPQNARELAVALARLEPSSRVLLADQPIGSRDQNYKPLAVLGALPARLREGEFHAEVTVYEDGPEDSPREAASAAILWPKQ